MSLNITYSGNIVDNESPIDCNYQVLYVRQNIWSPIHISEFNQYNFNAGTSTHLGQEGELKTNDVVIVAFFTEATRDLAHNGLFSAIAFIHDGVTTTYLQDVQLLPLQLPDCDWSITGSTINNNISITSNTKLEYEWFYADKKHYHKQFLYSKEIFSALEITDILYDFGLGFDVLNTHVYDSIGDYTIYYKAIMPNGQEINCEKIHKVTYNAPVPDIIFSPLNVKINDELFITAGITDIDSTITNINHVYIDGSNIANTILDFEYSKVLTSLDNITACQQIDYFDGFQSKTIEYCESLVMENQPPEVDLTPINTEDNNYRMDFVYDQIDDAVVQYRYKIYYQLPFSNNYILDLTESFNIDTPPTYDFLQSGTYKVVLELIDEAGNIGSDEEIITIECTGGVNTYNVYPCESYNREPIRVGRVPDLELDMHSLDLDLEIKSTNIDYDANILNKNIDIEKLNIDIDSGLKIVDLDMNIKTIDIRTDINNINIDISNKLVSSDFSIKKIDIPADCNN